MKRLYLFGISFVFLVLLVGCSSSSSEKEIDEVEIEEKQENNMDNPSRQESVSQEEMDLLKETLRTYIFDEYMGSSDYVYAKGINWSESFYDNLTAEEIWVVIEKYKEINNGEEGTLFDQASYLSVNAPIKENWKELFIEEWNKSYLGGDDIDNIEMIDKGNTVWIYTDDLPYTGEKDNYPLITLDKRTGAWHG